MCKIPIRNHNFAVNQPLAFGVNTKPIEYLLFFDDNSLDKICTETNLYANYKKKQSPSSSLLKRENVTVQEIKLHPLSELKDYSSVK